MALGVLFAMIGWHGVCSVVASLLGKASRATASEWRPFGEAAIFFSSISDYV